MVEGKIDELSNKPFNYFPIPNKAQLLPVNNQNTGTINALGFIQYQSTGEQDLKLSIDVALNLDEQKVDNANDFLSGYGTELSSVDNAADDANSGHAAVIT